MLVKAYLDQQRINGQIDRCHWTSDENAVAPYDFEYELKGKKVLLDVKSTNGEFSRTLHLSANEIRQIVLGDKRYDLYRVYSVSDEGAKLRIAEDIKSIGAQVFECIKQFPNGITPDGFSINPELFKFGAEIDLSLPEDEE